MLRHLSRLSKLLEWRIQGKGVKNLTLTKVILNGKMNNAHYFGSSHFGGMKIEGAIDKIA